MGSVALVTGSSRGIGAAIAQALSRDGLAVVVHGRDEQAIGNVRSKIESDGGRSMGVRADLTRYDEIEAMRARIESEFGPVDTLVANAASHEAGPGPLEDIPPDIFRADVDTNLTATFLTIKAFLPGMKERGHGTIVTISSAASRRPHVRNPIAYTAAKAGVEQMTKIIALQAGPSGVRVNCVAPETIMTELNEQRIPKESIGPMIEAHPIRRLGTPEDVAEATRFLCSDEAGWISGVVLDVAGGSVLV